MERTAGRWRNQSNNSRGEWWTPSRSEAEFSHCARRAIKLRLAHCRGSLAAGASSTTIFHGRFLATVIASASYARERASEHGNQSALPNVPLENISIRPDSMLPGRLMSSAASAARWKPPRRTSWPARKIEAIRSSAFWRKGSQLHRTPRPARGSLSPVTTSNHNKTRSRSPRHDSKRCRQ